VRKSPVLIDALFPRTRRDLLVTLLLHPDRWWYLSDLAKHLKVRPSSLQRELANLAGAGILRSRRDGNRVYYRADDLCPVLPELQGLLTKTSGLVDVLRAALEPYRAGIVVAAVYGSVARGEETSESDVDLLVVGTVGLADLSLPLRDAREHLGRAVNASLYAPEEFAKKAKSGHHLIRAVMERPKLFVLGTPDDLDQVAGGEARRGGARHEAGAG